VSGFLEQMAAASHERAACAAARVPLVDLRSRARDAPLAPALQHEHTFDLIAEYKLRSPALGDLADAGEGLAERVIAYARGGAAAVSVLTEPIRFRGALEHLAIAAAILAPLGIPVLRKDFIVDPYQLYETRASGAGGVLLIVRMVSDERLRELLDCARELRLFVLLEAFDADDIRRATTVVADLPHSRPDSQVLLGVNCRDLASLDVAPARFGDLAPLLPRNCVRVAESSVTTPDDCAEVVRAGYDMALIGGALMKARDPAQVIGAMLAAGRAAA
jgi:indole-3-glycerol phosphate synthase